MNNQPGIRELAEKAKAEGAYDLAQGVIDADPPQPLLKAMRNLELEKISRYDNTRGVKKYRQAIIEYLYSRNWPVELDQVMSAAGAMAGISSALLTNLRPEAKILLPEPFYIAHEIQLKALGFNIEYYPVPFGSKIDWQELADKMKEVDGAIITSPMNPTGHYASPRTMRDLCLAAKNNDCLLIFDEMYREFIWDKDVQDDQGYEELDLTSTVIVRSWSKTFAIPGWRVGYVITTPERIEKMAVIHDSLYIGGSTIAQHALANALLNNLDELNNYVTQLRQRLINNKNILRQAFTAYGLSPLPVAATYYMPVKHDRDTDMSLVEELIAKKIVTTPANILTSNKKDTGYIRVHFAVKPETATQVANILNP